MAQRHSGWLYLLVGLLLLLMQRGCAAKSKTSLIDGKEIESIAKTVCMTTTGTQVQIGRISTIKQLVTFFENLNSNHRLKACRDNTIDALHLLHDVVSKRNDNVCSDEKVTLIESFHHKYISKTKVDKKQQRTNKARVPKLLVLFFYHYAHQVSTICKNSLIKQINEVDRIIEELQTKRDPDLLYRADDFLTKFTKQIGLTSGSRKTYKEIFLVWNFIEKLPIKENSKYINESGKRCTFAAASAESVQSFQRECANRLRPLYGILALPVIRLIDLGYYLEDEAFSVELERRKELRRLIGVAQVCEFILPVRIVNDNWVPWGQLLLMTKEQANQISDKEGELIMPNIIHDNHSSSLLHLDALSTANEDEAKLLVKSIKKNIRVRERVMRKILSKMVNSIKGKVKSMIGKLFYFRKDQSKYIKKDVAPLIEDQRIPKFYIHGDEASHGQWKVGDGFVEDTESYEVGSKERSRKEFNALIIAYVGRLFDYIETLLNNMMIGLFTKVLAPILRLVERLMNPSQSIVHKLT